MTKHIDDFYEDARKFLVRLAPYLKIDPIDVHKFVNKPSIAYVANQFKDIHEQAVNEWLGKA